MDFRAEILKKYPYLADDVDNIVEKAKYFYCKRKCPYESAPNMEKMFEAYIPQQDVLQIAEEIIQRLGFNTASGYRENGVSFTFDDAWMSRFTQRLITPVARTISKGVK